jgi:hypothetical protein
LLNSDGSLDQGFDLGKGPNERVGALSIHADGSLYLPGRLQSLNGLSAAGLARVRFGYTGTAILDSGATPRDFVLHTAVFPGGIYSIETSGDLLNWTEAQSFTAEGFAREMSILLPRGEPKAFLRLLNKN